jgi:hypothetical protein
LLNLTLFLNVNPSQSLKRQSAKLLPNAHLISKLHLPFPSRQSFLNQPYLQPCQKLLKHHLLR